MSVEPVKISQTVWRGATFRKRYQVFEEDGTTPVNLTGYSASLEVFDPNTHAVLLTADSGSGQIGLTTLGFIQIAIPDTVTTGITWSGGSYELFLTHPDDTVDLLFYGAFRVRGIAPTMPG